MASTYLTRTFSSPTDRKIFTWSAWVKRQNFGITENNNALFSGYLNSNVRSTLRFNTDKLNLQDTEGSVEILTNRLFRDVSAWYHIVVAVDTTQATASNRVKFYVNGEQETSFAQADYPVQNSIFLMGGADIHYINARNASGSVDSIDNMCYSHIHFTDGTAYDATAFGQYDANGVWTIKTDVSVTYGNNGFFILKDGNSVTDQSGNSNNWTVGGGTLTNTEDNPSNVFATMNPLTTGGTSSVSLDRGNNQVNFDASGQWYAVYSTLGAITGKYYAEVLTDAIGGGTSVGIISSDTASLNQGTGDYLGKEVDSIGYFSNGDIKKQNVNQQTGLTNLSSTTIVGIAMDLDNNSVQFYVNGTSTGNAVSLTANKFYLFGTSGYSGARHRWNFGNGYFGTTAISSAGTNASGIGIFEYDVPTGYTALSTKGLNL